MQISKLQGDHWISGKTGKNVEVNFKKAKMLSHVRTRSVEMNGEIWDENGFGTFHNNHFFLPCLHIFELSPKCDDEKKKVKMEDILGSN